MRKPQVDTPYKNSWADLMRRGELKVPPMRIPSTFIEEEKHLKKLRRNYE